MTGRIVKRDTPVTFRTKSIRMPWQWGVLFWCVRRLAIGVWWLVRHPNVLGVLLAVGLMGRVFLTYGWRAVMGIMVALCASLVGWFALHAKSFRAIVLMRLWAAARRKTIYQWRWRRVMHAVGMVNHLDGFYTEPRLLSVRSSGATDRVRVQMIAGQTFEKWSSMSEELAASFKALDARVSQVEGKHNELLLTFIRKDPLARTVKPFAISEKVNLEALPVGIVETGGRYKLPLYNNHVLLFGATNSGKSSVIHAILSALAPSIRDGYTQILMVDPKRLELNMTKSLATEYAIDAAQINLMFAGVVHRMNSRADRLAAQGKRKHTPTLAEPYQVVLIDEMASFSHIADSRLRKGIEANLALILEQGRACGITIIGASQLITKDVVTWRSLFTVTICLRINESSEVGMALGSGARDRGAKADLIPRALPGVAYVGIDGEKGFFRVRFCYVTDEEIAARGREYATRLIPAAPAAESPAVRLVPVQDTMPPRKVVRIEVGR